MFRHVLFSQPDVPFACGNYSHTACYDVNPAISADSGLLISKSSHPESHLMKYHLCLWEVDDKQVQEMLRNTDPQKRPYS